MYVEQIKSRKYNKTFYKVGFDNQQELDDTKNALAHYKEVYIKTDNPISGSIELHDLLSSALNKIETDEGGKSCTILYEVELILCFFFILFQMWSDQDQLISILRKNKNLQAEKISLLEERISFLEGDK